MRPKESFIGQPIRSLQTMLRVIATVDTSLPAVIPDGIYGPSTVSAVIAFQQQYQLPVSGITDERTWNRIVAVYDEALIEADMAEPIEIIMDPGEVYVLGDSNPNIYLLQAMLTQLSKDHKEIQAPTQTGILDSKTSISLSQFQKLVGLPQTAQLNKKTWKYLSRHFTLNAYHQKPTTYSHTTTFDSL